MGKYTISSIIRFSFRLMTNLLYYRYRLGRIGIKSYIDKPLHIDGGKNIFLGNNVAIQYKTWLAAVPLTGIMSRLIIEDGCVIGNFNHIYATGTIVLHKNVLTADKVYISDNLHNYEDISKPILKQPIH